MSIDDEPTTPYADDETDAEMAKKNEDETFRVMVGVRLTREDADRLDALAARIPIASRHAIAREALRIGLALLEENPARLLGETPSSRSSTRTTRGRR